MSDERFAGAAAPPQGGGLTQNPAAAPGGVAEGGPPVAAQGALERAPHPGFALQRGPGAGGPGPLGALGPPPGMMINPDFERWRQLAAAWQQERQRRQLQFLSACNVIRRDAATGFTIDIEADSTVAADETEEKRARTEFLTAIMPLLQVIVPQIQTNPAVAPLASALVMFGMRAFPAARSLEEEFEQAFQTLAHSPPPEQPQKGNVKPPMEIAAEAATAKGEQQVDMAKLQIEQQKNAADMWKAYAQLNQAQQKQQADNMLRAAELAQQSEVQQARGQLVQARLAAMLSRSIGGGGLT
jgi:hypothetical protein